MPSSSDYSNTGSSGSSANTFIDCTSKFPKLEHYSHLLTSDEQDSYRNIRNVLNDTLTSEHGITSPALFSAIFSTGLKNFFIRDDLEHHKFALETLIDPCTDKSQLEFIDIAGPTAQALYLVIASVRSIKRLALEPYRIYGDSAIEHILINQDLEELEVRCSSRPCIFQNCESEPNAWHRLKKILAWHMPTLTTLSLSCQCHGNHDHIAMEMSAIIGILPNLINIRVAASARIAERVYEELWRLIEGKTNFEFHLLGDRSLTTRSEPHNFWRFVTRADIKRAQKVDVKRLAMIKRLDHIKLDIMDKAEERFEELCMDHVKLFHVSGSPAAKSGSGGVYYEVQKGFLLTAATCARHLEDVSLVYCRIDIGDVQSLLMNLGKNLKRFETSLLDQAESPSQRLLDILNTFTEFSPNLRQFLVSDCVVEDVANRLTWGRETFEGYSYLFIQLNLALEKLAHSSPLLDMMNLRDVIQTLDPDRELVAAMCIAYDVFFDSDDEE